MPVLHLRRAASTTEKIRYEWDEWGAGGGVSPKR